MTEREINDLHKEKCAEVAFQGITPSGDNFEQKKIREILMLL